MEIQAIIVSHLKGIQVDLFHLGMHLSILLDCLQDTEHTNDLHDISTHNDH